MIIDLGKRVEANNGGIDVKFGDKTWNVAFNDEFRKKAGILANNVAKLIAETDDSDEWNDKLENATKTEQRKMITKQYEKIREAVIDGLNDLLGEDAGNYLYKAYNESTEKLSAIIQLLSDQATKINQKIADEKKLESLSKYDTER